MMKDEHSIFPKMTVNAVYVVTKQDVRPVKVKVERPK